jgi:hypothetical protein
MRRKPSPWRGVAWCAIGLFALLVGITWSWFAKRQTALWLCADRYVDAELEVTHFVRRPTNSERSHSWIEGVIHPHGERIETSDEYIPIRRFISPVDRRRNEPTPGEIEGHRIDVSYWPRSAPEERWWHPPTVVARGALPQGPMAMGHVLIGSIFLVTGLSCFRWGARALKESAPFEPVD